jgi:hypothetical protein
MDFSKYVYQGFFISHQRRQYIITFEITDNMHVSRLPFGKLGHFLFDVWC